MPGPDIGDREAGRAHPRRASSGERRDDVLPGTRHLAIGRAIYWFDVDERRETVRILAVFFGGQDHVRRMIARLLKD